MKYFMLVVACCSFGLEGLCSDEAAQMAVKGLITAVRQIKMMKNNRDYTLEAGGVMRTGDSDSFLRRRSVAEIRKSGLSCGCGDYAAVFFALAKEQGFECIFYDSAQVSEQSLRSFSAGHAVVAVHKDGLIPNWWLVDPTNRQIVSQDWNPKAPSFRAFGHLYWIGYSGPMSGYPVHSPEELKAFYRRTLETVPQDILKNELAPDASEGAARTFCPNAYGSQSCPAAHPHR
jgi:hypothetical protein